MVGCAFCDYSVPRRRRADLVRRHMRSNHPEQLDIIKKFDERRELRKQDLKKRAKIQCLLCNYAGVKASNNYPPEFITLSTSQAKRGGWTIEKNKVRPWEGCASKGLSRAVPLSVCLFWGELVRAGLTEGGNSLWWHLATRNAYLWNWPDSLTLERLE